MNVDSQLQSLLKGMEDNGILGCVDIMVVSDHGMASTPQGKYFVLLKDFISDVATTTRTYDGVFPNIRPNTDTQGKTKFIMFLFTCHSIIFTKLWHEPDHQMTIINISLFNIFWLDILEQIKFFAFKKLIRSFPLIFFPKFFLFVILCISMRFSINE